MTVTSLRRTSQEHEPARRRYLRPARPIYFPTEQEVPETRRHLDLRTALYMAIRDTFAACATVGSDQFVYSDPTDPRQCCAPDLFVRMGQADAPFDSWKVWERGAPEVAVELISDSDAAEHAWLDKLARYRRAGIRELVRFDFSDAQSPLRIWDFVDGDLVERDPAGRLFRKCDALNCYWCIRAAEPSGVDLYLSHDESGDRPCISSEETARRNAERELREAKDELRDLEEKQRGAERHVQALEAELARLRR